MKKSNQIEQHIENWLEKQLGEARKAQKLGEAAGEKSASQGRKDREDRRHLSAWELRCSGVDIISEVVFN